MLFIWAQQEKQSQNGEHGTKFKYSHRYDLNIEIDHDLRRLGTHKINMQNMAAKEDAANSQQTRPKQPPKQT